MKHEKVIVQFRGFHPSDSTNDFIRSVVDEIHREAPFSSTLRATFSKRSTKEREYKGFVHIHSSAGPFFAIAVSPTLREVADKLLEQSRRKVSKWKSNRFNHDTLRKTAFRKREPLQDLVFTG
ncbi:MAG: hypothetical protein K2X47_15990 [Bdellovibrionales bacterium]|nr:hypothetical protein [Bdellovibrionales bacterium]